MKYTPEDWTVRVYNEEEEMVAEWVIYGRTEKEAFKEASAEVARLKAEDDWTMTSTDEHWDVLELPRTHRGKIS